MLLIYKSTQRLQQKSGLKAWNWGEVQIYNPSIQQDSMSGIILEIKDKETFLIALYQDETLSVSQCDFNLIKEKKIDPGLTIFPLMGGIIAGIVIVAFTDFKLNLDLGESDPSLK